MGLLTEIGLNNGQSVKVKPNGIIVFVGPNNAGKSQGLRDIYSLLEKGKNPTKVISSLRFDKPSDEELESSFQKHCKIVDNGDHKKYQSYNFNYNTYELGVFSRDSALGSARSFLASYLSTEGRLQLANPPQQITRKDVRSHPIHYAAFEQDYRKRLSSYFERAFGQKLLPNTQYGRLVPLCIGDHVVLDGEYSDEQERLEAYAQILESYPQVQNQGDGIRSFTGIVLNLMLENYKLFLLDEPESFLHPPQAKIIGEIIGEMTDRGKQVVISTHSKDVLRGLIEVCADRVTIVRITRDNDTNAFSILDNAAVKAIWADPLLRYSDIMDSMFHESVVLCESDSDCKMYSIVFEYVKGEAGQFSQTQFIHCGGKARMADVSKALKTLGIKCLVIPDFDVFNDLSILRKIVESCGGEWREIEDKCKILYSRVVQNENIHISRCSVLGVLGLSNEQYLSKEEIQEVKRLLTPDSPWSPIKKSGASALPRGDVSKAYEDISAYLKNLGIYVVPVGELESFITSVGGHGPRWVNSVLENYPDLASDSYQEIQNFIREWGL